MTMKGSIFITGGSGTLGQSIVRKALYDNWDCDITVYSRSELNQARMKARYPQVRYVLGDVRDYTRLSAAIAGHDIVIHGAAMKRIPEAEEQPTECYQTDVEGSRNVMRACIAANVSRCVGVSTDKACRAITAYGAAKLMMEKMFQAESYRPTIFTLVRYGNVVSSNGSVIPLWRKQAEEGKPLRLTDSRATRFWMTVDMAVELLENALEQPAGTILVPKMSKLNIADMARLVCPGAQLVEMGMRSTEKLHEDLVHEDEISTETPRHFLIGRGFTGAKYTSEHAPDANPVLFLEWVAEAEERESHANA